MMRTAAGLISMVAGMAGALAQGGTAAESSAMSQFFGLFPESMAPTYYGKKSELVLQKHLQPWARNSHWHPELDEKTVFHARLQHKSVEERSWEIGIGKGGQIYSMCGSFGEAMPPQSPHSQWVDETWQFTTIYGKRLGRDLPKELQSFENPFKEAEPGFEKYSWRMVYHAYRGKTGWVELLGFVMPEGKADMESFPSVPLSKIEGVGAVFKPGEKPGADAIVVRRQVGLVSEA